MEKWFEEAESNAMPGAVMYLVGSKLDRAATRKVKYEEGAALAANHGSQFCEVSSKTKENVRKPFIDIVDQISKNPELLAGSTRKSGTVTIGTTQEAGGCAC